MSVAGIDAVKVVEFKKVVERLFPLNRTTDPTVKPVPFTVSVKPRPPARTVAGEIAVIAGSTGRLTVLETPPPGVGLKTVICKFTRLTRSVLGMIAVSWVELTKVVVRALPLTRTMEPVTNLEPLTVSVKLVPPCGAFGGERLVIAGTGLLTVRFTEPDVPPLGVGLKTRIGYAPTVSRSDARIWAVSCVVLT